MDREQPVRIQVLRVRRSSLFPPSKTAILSQNEPSSVSVCGRLFSRCTEKHSELDLLAYCKE